MFCPLYRWKLTELAASGGEMSERVRRHLEQCPDCRRDFDAARFVEQRLRADLPPVSPLSNPLRERIRLATSTQPAAGFHPGPSRRLIPVMSALAAGAVVLAVATVLLDPSRDGAPQAESPVAQRSPAVTDGEETPPRDPDGIVRSPEEREAHRKLWGDREEQIQGLRRLFDDSAPRAGEQQGEWWELWYRLMRANPADSNAASRPSDP